MFGLQACVYRCIYLSIYIKNPADVVYGATAVWFDIKLYLKVIYSLISSKGVSDAAIECKGIQ